jgi:trk system potassium uptake protein TrkA
MNAEGDEHGSDRVIVEDGSPLSGLTLRQAELPISIIVTTIQRQRDLVVPDGATVLEGGDELVIIGTPSDIDAARCAARSAQPGEGADNDPTVHTMPE